MKFAKFLLTVSLLLGASLHLSASNPTFYADSYGWFSTSGVYPVEYWVDAYDSDGDLSSLVVADNDELLGSWQYHTGTGNGSHRQVHAWSNTVDGYIDGRVWMTDSTGVHESPTEFHY